MSKEAPNPDDSSQEKIEFHLRKALFFDSAKGRRNDARTEALLAERCYRASESDLELWPELAFVAAVFEILADKDKSRQLFDELKLRRESNKTEPGYDYVLDLIYLAGGISILSADSLAVAEALTEEALYQLNAEGRDKDALAATAQTLLGRLQLRRGNSKQALLTLRKARTICSSNAGSLAACQADSYLAKALLAEKKFDEVETICNERISIERQSGFKNDEFPSILASLADAYYQTGKPAEAKALFDNWQKELKELDSNLLYTSFSREFVSLQSERKQDLSVVELDNDAIQMHETTEAGKCDQR